MGATLISLSECPTRELEGPTPPKLEFGHLFVLSSPALCVYFKSGFIRQFKATKVHRIATGNLNVGNCHLGLKITAYENYIGRVDSRQRGPLKKVQSWGSGRSRKIQMCLPVLSGEMQTPQSKAGSKRIKSLILSSSSPCWYCPLSLDNRAADITTKGKEEALPHLQILMQ